MRRWVVAVVGVAAAVSIVGCSSTQSGQPVTTVSSDPSGSPTTNPSNSDSVAARIRTPLNDTRLISDPCSALTGPQLQGVGFTTAVKSHVQQLTLGNICAWNDDTVGTVGASASVAVQTTLSHGLSDIYTQRSGMGYFTPVTIEGYPAVLADLTDQRDSGTCALNLGVSDTSALVIDYHQGDLGLPACDKVQAIARAVVETLKGA
jgi:Protein of unknown function (DUF3558)